MGGWKKGVVGFREFLDEISGQVTVPYIHIFIMSVSIGHIRAVKRRDS